MVPLRVRPDPGFQALPGPAPFLGFSTHVIRGLGACLTWPQDRGPAAVSCLILGSQGFLGEDSVLSGDSTRSAMRLRGASKLRLQQGSSSDIVRPSLCGSVWRPQGAESHPARPNVAVAQPEACHLGAFVRTAAAL